MSDLTLSQQLLRRRVPAGVHSEDLPADIHQFDEPAVETKDGHVLPGEITLKRSLSTFHLTMIGVGGTVGTGIFFILSEAVPEAGPAVVVSFLLGALVAGLTVVCYAELASVIPSSGSSYSYTYATMGELAAFVVGACLILEYGVSAAAVAVGWSEYVALLIHNVFGTDLPHALLNSPETGGIVNLPAVILVLMCFVLLLRGASESAVANTIMVITKITVLVAFSGVAFTAFNADNFSNFAPMGVAGVSIATGSIFFSFIGLDAVATTGDEVKDPQKAVPRALILALIVVTGIYLLVAVSALGAQHWTKFEGQQAGLAQIVENVTGSSWPGTVLALGAVISIFSVTLICLYGQTRILYSMGRDGLLPKAFSRVHPKTRVPTVNTWVVAIAVSILAGFLPIGILADMTSIGTLSAFLLVSIGVMVLRKTAPNLKRGFKVPFYPLTPILSIVACLYVMHGLGKITWAAFAVWMIVALSFYFLWARKNSDLQKRHDAGTLWS
ncbi:MAG: amino acid permease [Scrofimicrobium sp.]